MARQRHQRRPGHRPARSQHPVAKALAQAAGIAVGLLDRDIAVAERLRKHLAKEAVDLRRVHFGPFHAVPCPRFVLPPALNSSRS